MILLIIYLKNINKYQIFLPVWWLAATASASFRIQFIFANGRRVNLARFFHDRLHLGDPRCLRFNDGIAEEFGQQKSRLLFRHSGRRFNGIPPLGRQRLSRLDRSPAYAVLALKLLTCHRRHDSFPRRSRMVAVVFLDCSVWRRRSAAAAPAPPSVSTFLASDEIRPEQRLTPRVKTSFWREGDADVVKTPATTGPPPLFLLLLDDGLVIK